MVEAKYSENQNNILFTKDREAVTAYCDGEAVNNISAHIEEVNAAPYGFKSEYNKGLYSLDIKGNAKIIGTPTPETPADIVNMGDNGIKITSQSLLTAYDFNQSINIPSTYRMAKINNTADKILINKGQIKYTRNIYRYVFTGTEGFYTANGFPSRFNVVMVKQNTTIPPICTHYKGSNVWWSQIGNNQITTNTGATLCIRDDRFTTAAEFKNYVKELYDNGTPIVVEYVLQTPIETDITSEIESYNEFMSTPYNTDLSIDIQSLLPPSSETLKYLKWGGKTE